MKYKPYSKYIDSGVEWLGEIPEEWDTLRIGFFYSRTKETDRADMQLLSVYRDYGVIPKDSRDDNFNNASEDLSIYQVVREGDLVINKMKAWQGSLGISAHEGIVSPAYFVLRPVNEYAKSFKKQFFHYLLRSQIYFAEYEKRSKGIRINQWDLPYEEFKTISVLLPSVATQRAIATFLDTETARIDGLIKDYEELIELLKEKRQALISHAVTRGLSELVSPDDPDFGEWVNPVKFKDSGAEWIGEIPEGWEVKPIKWVVTCPVMDGPHETPEFYSDGIPFLSAEAVKNDRLDFEKKRGFISLNDNIRFSQKCKPEKYDIFMVKSGATTGNLAMVETDEEFNIWSPLAVIRVNRILAFPRFVFYSMKSQSFFESVKTSWNFGTQQNIGMRVIENIKICIPVLSAQQSIAAFLDRETYKIDTLVTESESAIELLKEHRSALITNVVTGKINVENIA